MISLLVGMNVSAQANGTLANTLESDKSVDFRACINQYPDNVVQFRVEKGEKDIVWFVIKDNKGLIIYQKRVKKHTSVEVDCDVSHIPAGKYEYIIERNGEEYLSKTIEKS